jgi:hypothetical protein
MSDDAAKVVLAEYDGADALLAAARLARERGFAPHDALSPHRIEAVEEMLELPRSPVRRPMLIAGIAAAALAYGVESYSAILSYPFNSGGRPFNSWPVFLLVPFEFGVLVAAAAGLIAFLILCRLPRLNHPLFDNEKVDRATIDRFFLLFGRPAAAEDARRLTLLLEETRALSVEEVSA